jgi:EAL domain-containing protein (putative c-di-GMP-specific phosphodiesterase class I)/FixJ family two-component response regulator
MPCNLLLVDDEPNIPKALRRSLRGEGYHFLTASSASEAFDLLRATPVDVVISDYRMPGISGSEFLAEVSARYPRTVRLMLSGEADIEGVIDAINGGNIFKFLNKPWSNERLRGVVREAATRALARHVDAQTGWQTEELFGERLRAVLEDAPLRIVVAEIRNMATVSALLTDVQQRRLADKVEHRTKAITGELLVDLAALDRGLFAFAVPVAGNEDLLQGVVERLCAPFAIEGQAVTLHVAMGYVDSNTVPEDDPAALVRMAIVALAGIATEPKRLASYHGNSRANLKQMQALEHDLTRASAQRQLFLQLQPQVGARDMRIRGAEALIRWRHHEHGLVSPAQFIGMAERNGMINDIGVWVVCAAMQHLEALDDLGIDDVRLSINVSPRQFESGPTASWVTVLRQYAAEQPELLPRLEIEVTESTVMACTQSASALLAELKALGMRIAMDDFGTGHSSLAQLKGMPLDVLKLDRSLIQDIEEDARSLTLVGHLAKMARDLGLEVIVEGVETQGQVMACRDIGCDLIQGYAFYKPLDSEDFYRVLRSERLAAH